MSALRADDRKVVVPPKWWEILPREVYSHLEKVETAQPWFEVYRIDPGIYVIYEPGQFEEAISYLVLGEERAALIDTGCGIGDINDEVAVFDDPVSRNASEKGYDHDNMAHLIAEGMTWKPLPEGFDKTAYHVPPFRVTRWLRDGDAIDLGGRRLEVIYAPGHSPDSICLLDRGARLLWTGDLFYTGGIYTYLPGGDIDAFIESYGKLIGLFPHYDRLMPSHNEPWVEKEILKEVQEAVEDIKAGRAGGYIEGMDGDVKVRRYNYERFSIITRVE
jgi:glyoxylase-like metal-dependent hydrolase (beta-lactamase superfamily II)